jgi:hypothetical protein
MLCSHFYGAYKQRFDFLSAQKINLNANHDDLEPHEPASPVEKVAQKVLHFADGAPLYDRTSTQRVKIEPRKTTNIVTDQEIVGEDQIFVDEKRVLFSNNPKERLAFGTNYGTEEVFVTDLQECPELVFIHERETDHTLKTWVVDITQPTTITLMGAGILAIGPAQEVFIAHEIVTPAPQPIIDT